MKFKPLIAEYKEKTKNQLTNTYFNAYLKNAVEMAGLKGDETVLDFGCDDRRLKIFFPKSINYVGFDIVKEKTDYKRYEDIKQRIDVAFCIHVLEHAGEKDTTKFLKWAAKKKIKKIVVVTPAKTSVSDLLSFFSGDSFIMAIHHVLDWIQVHRLVASFYGNSKTRLVWFMSWVSLWELDKVNLNTK